MNIRALLITLILFTAAPFTPSAQEYFQQEVNYRIDVTLDDQKHMLHGFEEIRYTNHSPDELTYLYFHLWPNAYKNNNTALAKELFKREGKHLLFKVNTQRGYIDSLNFKVNGQIIKWEFHPEHIDICKLILNEPLKKGETMTITTPFRVKIPLAVSSRFGHAGQAYKITQWYPKPAVYDRQGWHPMPYIDMGEFYSEYGSFDVSITLPKNYVVAASGDLKTQSEIKWLNQKAAETKRTYNYNYDELDFPSSSPQQKTIRYTMENTHDFAWFADKRFHVLKDSVKLPRSEKTVTSWAFFTSEQADMWQNATGYINKSLQYFSAWYGDYPYNNCSAVYGPSEATGGGMEYPGITVIDRTTSDLALEEVIIHEVAHNWFYGLLGFNERRHPYLDEGLTTLSEKRYMKKEHPGLKLYERFGMGKGMAGFIGAHDFDYEYMNELLYLFKARKNRDQPTNTTSKAFTQSNYFAIAYMKSARAFTHLMQYLGEERFDSTMQAFVQQWKFKHPSSEDMHAFFKEQTGKELNWFFKETVQTKKKTDYKAKRVKDDKILIKNKGDIAAPLFLSGKKNNSILYSHWKEGFTGKKWMNIPFSEVEKIEIDAPKHTLELYRHNNHIKTSGLFPKIEPLKIEFGGLFNNPNYTQIQTLPALAWNYYDKAMLGMLFYDAPLPPDKLDYYLVPAYSVGNNVFSGTGNLRFNFYPEKIFQNIHLELSGKRFSISDVYEGQYEKVKSKLTLEFNHEPTRKVSNRLTMAAIYATDITGISDRILNRTREPFSYKTFYQAGFSHDRSMKSINPYDFTVHFEGSNNYMKSWVEANYKLSYYMEEGFSIRVFGGTFLQKSDNLPWDYAFHLSGENGFRDYLYENTYLGRFEPPLYENAIRIFAQQFYPNDGAFALYTPLGITNDWMVAINLKTSLPLVEEIPVHAYANIGFFGESQPVIVPISNNQWALESGFKFSFLNFIDIYFPVAASRNLQKASDYYSKRYGEKIRFHIHFDLLKPSSILDRLNF